MLHLALNPPLAPSCYWPHAVCIYVHKTAAVCVCVCVCIFTVRVRLYTTRGRCRGGGGVEAKKETGERWAVVWRGTEAVRASFSYMPLLLPLLRPLTLSLAAASRERGYNATLRSALWLESIYPPCEIVAPLLSRAPLLLLLLLSLSVFIEFREPPLAFSL